jgi:hypothetical protein
MGRADWPCCEPSVAARAAHRPDRGASGRARHSLGFEAPMGRVGTDALAVLDGVFTGPDRDSPYDHPHHDQSVLRKPSGHTRRWAAESATGVGEG